MKHEIGVTTSDGKRVLTYDEIQKIRDAIDKKTEKAKIVAQAGGQERMLACNADIIIGGGSRGGSKTYSLLMEALRDVTNPDFRAVLLRKEIGDLSDMIETSRQLFSDFGTYNRSVHDMVWNFDRGGFLKFSYHSDSVADFKLRFQGKQFAYIGVDEITHIDYAKFKYLTTCNRNAFGIRNRFFGTCNPDPESWVATYIDWWIGEDGLPIPERNGVVRYCFMDGDDIGAIYWGDTKKEVYEKCRHIIDGLWDERLREYGNPEDLFIKSVAFVEAKLIDNRRLLSSDPTYYANLAGQSEEQRERDLLGNWKYKVAGSDLIKFAHMEAFYNNAQQTSEHIRYASCDAAFDGGDSLVMWLWEDWHASDVFVCRLDSRSTVEAVQGKLEEWRVAEQHFTYDLNGLGQAFKGFFPKAVPFNNREAVDDKYKNIYANLKSQAAHLFADKLIHGEISIEPSLLERKYSGRNYTNLSLRDILNMERRAVNKDESSYDRGWSLIRKVDMKRRVGHSPDFVEALLMRAIFEIKKKGHKRPKGMTRYVSPMRIGRWN